MLSTEKARAVAKEMREKGVLHAAFVIDELASIVDEMRESLSRATAKTSHCPSLTLAVGEINELDVS